MARLCRRRGRHGQQRETGDDRQPRGGERFRRILGALLIGAFAAATTSAATAAQPTAVFDIEIYDTSGEGARPDLADRLARISDELRDLLAAAPDYQLVDLSPARDRIDALGHRYGCNGCEAAIAREFGATTYVTGLIHKISTLILTIQIIVRDAETGSVQASGTADIRGDNDRAWSHGVRWLVRNRILAD